MFFHNMSIDMRIDNKTFETETEERKKEIKKERKINKV